MTIAENVITVVEGVPVFRNESIMWPHLIAERPQGPSHVVSTVIRVVDRESILTNFRTSSRNGETTWLVYTGRDGIQRKLHVVALGPRITSNDHVIFYLQQELISPERTI